MDDSHKAKMTLTSGIMFIIIGKQGACGIPLSDAHPGMSKQKSHLAEKTQLLPAEEGLNMGKSFTHWASRSEIKSQLHSTDYRVSAKILLAASLASL